MIKLYPSAKAAEIIQAAYDDEQLARASVGLRAESMSSWATELLLSALAERAQKDADIRALLAKGGG